MKKFSNSKDKNLPYHLKLMNCERSLMINSFRLELVKGKLNQWRMKLLDLMAKLIDTGKILKVLNNSSETRKNNWAS